MELIAALLIYIVIVIIVAVIVYVLFEITMLSSLILGLLVGLIFLIGSITNINFEDNTDTLMFLYLFVIIASIIIFTIFIIIRSFADGRDISYNERNYTYKDKLL